MEQAYSDPTNPGAFSGINRFYESGNFEGKSRKDVANYLASEPAYSLYKPRRYKFRRNKFIIRGLDDLWQGDLADMSSLASENDNYRYLLVIIDSFSKFLWVLPVKRKSAASVTEAIQKVLERASPRKPDHFLVDKGGEFRNSVLQNFMREAGINFYTTRNPDTKAAIAERSIRTLKGRIYRFLTKNNTKRYIDHLDDIVTGYNRAKHRAIGMRPIDVTKASEGAVRRRLYPGKLHEIHTFPYSVGDAVRLAKEKTPFQKGYLPLWTEEIFTVAEVIQRDPPVARVKDSQGEMIEGTFYKQELQKVIVNANSLYRVERVLEERADQDGHKSYLVRWLGYPSSMNSWVNESDMTV